MFQLRLKTIELQLRAELLKLSDDEYSAVVRMAARVFAEDAKRRKKG